MPDNDSNPEIPFIVTEDFSSEQDDGTPYPQPHVTSPSSSPINLSPLHLSPVPILKIPVHPRSGLEAFTHDLSRSPSPSYASSTDERASSSSHPPPSPTLSTRSSVHFAPPTTVNLRENKPGDGIGSLNLLSPNYQSHHSRRKGSVSSTFTVSSQAETEPDSHITQYGLTPMSPQWSRTSASPSPTHTHFDMSEPEDVDGTTVHSHSRAHSLGKLSLSSRQSSPHPPPLPNTEERDNDAPADAESRQAVDLVSDDDVDLGCFTLGPNQLARLVDGKNMQALQDMGGVVRLVSELGTHLKRGLVVPETAARHSGHHRHESENTQDTDASHSGLIPPYDDGRPGAGPGAGSGASQRHDRQQRSGIGTEAESDGDGGETEAVPGIIVHAPASDTGSPLPTPAVMDDEGSTRYGDNESQEGSIFKDRDELEGQAAGNDGAFGASFEDRKRVYGTNVLPTRKTKSLLELMWLALKDKVLVLLSIAAVVSLALGFFQDFGTQRPAGEPPVDWVEGVAIIIAILIVVLVGSLNDWQKERQFQVLNEKKEERGVKVIRQGEEHVVDVKEVVVGDIALLEPGEIIPCDGVFLSGHNVRCDESAVTGESDAIRKVPYEECLSVEGSEHHSVHGDCFVTSGSKVLEGYGQYVVVAVGTKSYNGRIMMALRGDTESTPLQLKLNDLAELIAKAGSAAGTVLFVALMIRFFVELGTGNPSRTASEKGLAFVQILIISVTLVVVAVPEGLPLAVTLALAFATKRMTKEKLLVRVLGSCETMANASVVCTDKTGTLTQNAMVVVAGTIGIHCKFVKRLEENQARTNASEAPENEGRGGEGDAPVRPRAGKGRKHTEDFSVDQAQLTEVLAPALRTLLNDAIAVNSTAFEDKDAETGVQVFVGSKTETALLSFAKDNGWEDYRRVRQRFENDIVQMLPFSSARKAMGIVVRLPGHNKRWRVYFKGASEILTKSCSSYVSVARDDTPDAEGGRVETHEIDDMAQDNISRTIIFYANQMLRTIALCYRDFDYWPPPNVKCDSEDEVPFEDLAHDLTLIGIVGIEDPLREGVREAVADCHKAGVTVKMCTGDNVLTARSIALQCGIFTPGGIIMEGPFFRQLSREDLLDIVPRLQVLARSSPDDKKLLVQTLRDLGEIVGVTGDGTNDGPAMRTADVGFSMGIAGTEVAKEASDIILMDDNFSSIVKAIMWGRTVNDAVRKFLQFQLSTNVTAVVITIVSAVASSSETSVLSAVQLLWVNIIMDTFAALALATDPASHKLLERKPDRKTAPLFTVDMYKQIIGQSAYQIFIVLLFHFLGSRILTGDSSTAVQTVNFNLFVFAQIFNSLNSRRLDNKLNVFEGMLNNIYFIGITLLEIAVQILIVFVGGAAFSVTKISGRDWGISLALGFASLPLGALLRCIPNGPTEKLFIAIRLMRNPEVLPTAVPSSGWNSAINLVRDNLQTFAHVRGARMRASSYVGKSRKALPAPEGRVALSSIMTMVPTLVASSIGAGWAPQSPDGLSDPARFDPSKSSAALWEGKIQFHPETTADDPALKRWGSVARHS